MDTARADTTAPASHGQEDITLDNRSIGSMNDKSTTRASPLKLVDDPTLTAGTATDNASTGESANVHSPNPPRHPRSCTLCRQRKVKCDRQQPCSCCIRSRFECTYPFGPGRAPKRPRNTSTLNAQVMDKLRSLEQVIKRLTSEREAAFGGYGAPTGGPVGASTVMQVREKPRAGSELLKADTSVEQQFGRLIIEELRDMLYEPVSEDGSCTHSQTPASKFGTPLQPTTTIFGFSGVSDSMRAQHPPLFQSVALLSLFTENVLPLVHIFHMPTTSRLYWDAIETLDSLDRNTEALLFAIYYSAILSADPERRESILGISSNTALETYRFAVEQAITRADLLNTRSILLLQAVVLFLSALRNEDDSRTAWSLIPLVLRIAQAMGLHRDGTIFGLKPLEIEVRRRLWYHICLLDIRSSEYHGYEPIIHEATFDTKLPLNVNDGDLSQQMSELPPERDGPTEMTFCLIRCEAMRTGCKVGYAPPSLRIPGLANGSLSVKDREALVEDLRLLFEDRYLRHYDSSQPFQRFYTVVSRLIIARTRLVVLYPLGHKDAHASSLSAASRNRLFSISMEVLELSNLLLTDRDLAKWAWHGKTHVQWHAIAFILSEICSRPPSAECDRAWQCITTVMDGWEGRGHDQKGSLWGPVRRLMAKARYVREMQRGDSLGGVRSAAVPDLMSGLSDERMRGVPYPLAQPGTTSGSLDGIAQSMDSFPGNFTMETPGSYIESTLEDFDLASLAPWWIDTSITM